MKEGVHNMKKIKVSLFHKFKLKIVWTVLFFSVSVVSINVSASFYYNPRSGSNECFINGGSNNTHATDSGAAHAAASNCFPDYYSDSSGYKITRTTGAVTQYGQYSAFNLWVAKITVRIDYGGGRIVEGVSDGYIYTKFKANSETPLALGLSPSGEYPMCENKPSGSTASPIHIITGNKFKQAVDISSDNLMQLSFKRFYNSHDPRTGELGFAWRHSYDRSVVTSREGKVATVNRPDGVSIDFNNYMGNGWVTDLGITSTLTQNANGWMYKTAGNTELYNSQGQLTSITSAKGRVVTISSSSGLKTITDDAGNILQLHYTNALLSSAVMSDGRTWSYQYDANNNLERVTNPDNTFLTYHYDNVDFIHGLTGITDERGIAVEHYEYDYKGRANASYKGNKTSLLSERIDSVSVRFDGLSYQARQIINSRGAVTTYDWKNLNGAKAITNITGHGCSSCSSTGNASYVYDNAFNVTSNTKNGVTTNYGDYDSNGNYGYEEIAVSTPEQRRIDYTYDPRFYSKVTSKTEPSVYTGQTKVTNYSYDNFGNLTQLSINGYTPTGAPVSRTTTFSYNGPLNQLSQIDGSRSDVSDITTIDYYINDASQGSNRARVKRITTGGIITRDNIQYTSTGKVASEQRANGVTLNYQYYNGNDRLQRLTQSGGSITSVTEWTYLASGEVETITRNAGTAAATTITLGYDVARRLTSVTDNNGNRIEYTLDSESNRTNQNVYDSANQLQRALTKTFDLYNALDTSSQENETVNYNFSPDGTLDTIVDGKNVTTDYNYDALKRLISTTQDLGSINAKSDYGYDAQDNLTSVSDPKGGNTTYSYDDLGNLLSQTSPDTGTTQFSYDSAGNLKTKTDAKGQTISYNYDALNRLLNSSTSDSRTTTYLYDQNATSMGRLSSVSDNDSSVSYVYDAIGNIIEVTQTSSGQSHTLSYSYNSVGQLTSLTYPSGATLSYGYTGDEVTSLTLNGQPLINNIQYQAFGSVKSWQWGNGAPSNRVFDLAGRLSEQTLADKTRNLAFDSVGNIESIIDRKWTQTYGYDNLNRLTSSDESETVAPNTLLRLQSIDYDINGNRTQIDETNASTTTMDVYAIDASSNRLSNISGSTAKTYSYDDNGNILSDGAHSYSYDARNRLIQVDGSVNYVINPLGQRVAKLASSYTYYSYDTAGHLIGEYDATSSNKTEYVYFNNEPIALIRNGTIVYIHTDHLGTPRAVTTADATNKVLWHWNSDAFGKAAPNEDVDGDGTNFVMNLRFPGQYYDTETGLHYNYFRDYDPSTGRYVQSDPIGLDGGLNTYGYVGGNPLRFIDPEGLLYDGGYTTQTATRVIMATPVGWGIGAGIIAGDLLFPDPTQQSVVDTNKEAANDSMCRKGDGDGDDPCKDKFLALKYLWLGIRDKKNKGLPRSTLRKYADMYNKERDSYLKACPDGPTPPRMNPFNPF